MATTTLQKITTNAKKLVKANPKLKWQEAIKKASAELKKAPVKVTLSKSVKTNVGAKPTKRHVDTKSHNVNIKVGEENRIINKFNQLIKDIEWNKQIVKLSVERVKSKKDKFDKQYCIAQLKKDREYLKLLIQEKNALKKLL